MDPQSLRRARISCIVYRSTYTVHGSLAIALARKLMGAA